MTFKCKDTKLWSLLHASQCLYPERQSQQTSKVKHEKETSKFSSCRQLLEITKRNMKIWVVKLFLLQLDLDPRNHVDFFLAEYLGK
jgi:hypothetical protein